jgi:hypothetical protein
MEDKSQIIPSKVEKQEEGKVSRRGFFEGNCLFSTYADGNEIVGEADKCSVRFRCIRIS